MVESIIETACEHDFDAVLETFEEHRCEEFDIKKVRFQSSALKLISKRPAMSCKLRGLIGKMKRSLPLSIIKTLDTNI